MAVASSWKGYVDTELNFTEFFDKDHTLVLRFMPQFPNAYEGPFVAENGTGTFVVGQGNWLNGPGGTKLYIAVGSQSDLYPVPLTAGTWYHLAVVVNVSAALQRTFTLYLDGVQLGQPLVVAAGAGDMPTGTLRFGKRSTGEVVNGHNAQYYGFLDDIAIFTSALTVSEIQDLQSNTLHLTGSESNLLAGYTFAAGPLPTKLARSVVLHGTTQLVDTSADRDSASDAALLPLPTMHQVMNLPFAPGEAWLVVKGVDTNGEHHEGHASFCWDFVLADQGESKGEYPNGTGGAPLYAAAPGKAITVYDSEPSATKTPNLLEIEQAPEEICGYMHLRQNSIEVAGNATVVQGQKIALAGSTGLEGCFDCNHLHFAVSDMPDGTPDFVTIPIAFSNYQVRTATDTWQNVSRGMPLVNQVVRVPPPAKKYILVEILNWFYVLTWSWVIVVGGLMITPGGIDCIRCGPELTRVLGIISIVIGVLGFASRAVNRRTVATQRSLPPSIDGKTDMRG
jgi:hypothetical protein